MLKKLFCKYCTALSIIVTVLWMSLLIKTDSYYSNYLFIGLICLLFNKKRELKKREKNITYFFSLIFSLLVVLSNYQLCVNVGNGKTINIVIVTLLLFMSGCFVFYNLLNIILFNINNIKAHLYSNYETSDKKIFLLTFICITSVDLFILFLSKYPGELSYDSILQINQIKTGIYSNHHPFWHTMIIKLFYNLGYNIFNNSNAAVATYSIFQIIIMGMIESYANMTLKQIGTNKIVNIVFCLFFAFVPYNYLYSFTMWKDVFFGGFVLLFITCVFRIYRNIGNMILNYILFAISCFCFCLFRSNGWYAFCLTLLFISFFKKAQKKIIVIMLICLICTYIMQHQLLNKFNVKQPDIVESLSIPIQQISRVIVSDNDLTDKELFLLNKVIEVNKINDEYVSWISDPIKELIREKNNQKYLLANIHDYFKLYIKLGLRHPLAYMFAYIDQTKGYYNGGYEYWISLLGISQNDHGIRRIEVSPFLSKIINDHYNNYYSFTFLNPLISIGLHVWIIMGCLYIGIINKNDIKKDKNKEEIKWLSKEHSGTADLPISRSAAPAAMR